MTTGAKITLGSAVVLVLAVGIRVGLIYKANHEEAKPQPTAEQYKLTDDDVATVTLKRQYPSTPKDERALIGKPIWMSAGGQMDYYHYANHHVDYAHPVGVLLGAQKMIVRDVFEQKAPDSGRAVMRIPPGVRHVLLAFTLPDSDNPKAEYALPVGNFDGTSYTFVSDQIFFYDDPHTLYKHWSPEMWAHIDKHEAVPGMNENQAMMALGEVITPSSDNIGNRTVHYDNNGHPMKIVFDHNKATSVTPD